MNKTIMACTCIGGPLDGRDVEISGGSVGEWYAFRHSDGGFLIYRSQFAYHRSGEVNLVFHDSNGRVNWETSAPLHELTRIEPTLVETDPMRGRLIDVLWDRCDEFGDPDLRGDLCDKWMELLGSLGVEVRNQFPGQPEGFFVLDARAHPKQRSHMLPARRRCWLLVPNEVAMKILALGCVP